MRSILRLIAFILILVWVLGLFGIGSGMGLGNLIYVLLGIAVIILLYDIITSRRIRE